MASARRVTRMTLDEVFDTSGRIPPLPIVVDLDRTLVTVDVFHAQLSQLLLRRPWLIFWVLATALRGGLPVLKQAVFDRVGFVPAHYRLHPRLAIELGRAAEGRVVEVATGACGGVARAITAGLPGVTAVSSSEPGRNLTSSTKAAYLSDKYGERGFYYVGDSRKDLKVGARAAGLVMVDGRGMRESDPARRMFRTLRELSREIRAKHWLKNMLVFVPLVASHEIFERPEALLTVGLLFVAISLVASSTYVLNDLIDYPNDAVNPLKSHRPLVSGAVSFPLAIGVAVALFSAGFGVAALLGWRGVLSCAAYLVLTMSYMYVFKRRMLLDILALAGLYVLRILIGGFVIEIDLTSWLLLFALFFFFSLACVKRYTEIVKFRDGGHDGIPGRSYRTGDGLAVAIVGSSSGFAAILLYALYISADAVRDIYAHPGVLVLGLPVLLYWMSHLWLHGLRLEVDADPIDWAARDWRSIGAAAVFLLVYLGASLQIVV